MIAYASGATVENAALTAGISRSTAHRRLNDPKFQDGLRALRSDMIQRTSGALTFASVKATQILLSLLDESMPANVRLGAVRGGADHAGIRRIDVRTRRTARRLS